MSVTNYRGEKVNLSRVGKDQFWKRIHDHYAREDATKWKHLAMLSLHETAGWPLEQVGNAFNHHKGHVQRCIQNMKKELQRRFDVDWKDADPDEETALLEQQEKGGGIHEDRADESERIERGSVQSPQTARARVA